MKLITFEITGQDTDGLLNQLTDSDRLWDKISDRAAKVIGDRMREKDDILEILNHPGRKGTAVIRNSATWHTWGTEICLLNLSLIGKGKILDYNSEKGFHISKKETIGGAG